MQFFSIYFYKTNIGWEVLCKVTKATTYKEAWKILEAKFSARGSNEVEDSNVVYPVVIVLEDENEDGYVPMDLQWDEDFGGSHLKPDHNVDCVLSTGVDFGIDNVSNGEATY